MKRATALVALLLTLSAGYVRAQSGQLTTLVNFNWTNGSVPRGPMVFGRDGSLYGVTQEGGSHDVGSVFRLTTNGILTTLHHFDRTNGATPGAGLIPGGDDFFYGTTAQGGTTGHGTLFRITTNGVLTKLADFHGTNGYGPDNPLTLGIDGNLYGVTIRGGSYDVGTIYKATTNGVITTLVDFNGDNGFDPVLSQLIQTSNGDLFGSTAYNQPGSESYGRLFKLTASGDFSTVVHLGLPQGAAPGKLILGTDGSFYGIADSAGSPRLFNAVSQLTVGGTVFRVTTNGVVTTLAEFDPNSCFRPLSLVEGGDGNFYGTTYFGKISDWQYDWGAIFLMKPDGILIDLFNFNGTNGRYPMESLTPTGGKVLYGMTIAGGANGFGTLFKLNVLPPLHIHPHPDRVILDWADTNCVLQISSSPAGPFTNLSASSPYTNAPATSQFYRLFAN